MSPGGAPGGAFSGEGVVGLPGETKETQSMKLWEVEVYEYQYVSLVCFLAEGHCGT